MALGSTQPLTEMSTRNISWGEKAATTFTCRFLEIWELNLLEPSGHNYLLNFIWLNNLKFRELRKLNIFISNIHFPPILPPLGLRRPGRTPGYAPDLFSQNFI
jgi:hypothetical protein